MVQSPPHATSTEDAALSHRQRNNDQRRTTKGTAWVAYRCSTVSGREPAAGSANRLPARSLIKYDQVRDSTKATQQGGTTHSFLRLGISMMSVGSVSRPQSWRQLLRSERVSTSGTTTPNERGCTHRSTSDVGRVSDLTDTSVLSETSLDCQPWRRGQSAARCPQWKDDKRLTVAPAPRVCRVRLGARP